MTQDKLWLTKYNEVMDFMQKNHRNPSNHYPENRDMHNWLRHNRKLMNAGKMKQERIDMFMNLLETGEKYKRVNQYV